MITTPPASCPPAATASMTPATLAPREPGDAVSAVDNEIMISLTTSLDAQLTTYAGLTTPSSADNFYFCDEDERIFKLMEVGETYEEISENEPGDDPNNACQEWGITSPLGTVVRVEFLEFDVSMISNLM